MDHTVWSLHVLSVEYRLEIQGQAGMVSPKVLQTGGGQRAQLSSALEEETLGYLVLRKAEVPVTRASSQNPPVLQAAYFTEEDRKTQN